MVIFIPQKTTPIPRISTPKSIACFPARRNHNYSVDFAGLQAIEQRSF
jgi:hypothetical protein